jgi:hypothetical protein
MPMIDWNIRLAQADRAVDKIERLIVQQRAFIIRLEGDNKTEAAGILSLMDNTLADFSRHRELLRRAIAATA